MSDPNPTDLLAVEAAETARKADTRRVADEAADDFRWLMSDKRGRRIVARLLADTGVFRCSFTGNSETYFREGERNVGLRLLAQVNDLTPELYPTMLREQRQNNGRR